MTRRVRKLAISAIPNLLDAQRKLFSEVKEDLVDSQKEQLDLCLQLWRTSDASSRQWARARARSFLVMVYNDKALGAEVFLLCGLGISVTRLGTIDPVEALSEVRKWWRRVEHPRGLAETAKDYVNEHKDVFSTFQRKPNALPPPTIVNLSLSELFNFLETKVNSTTLKMTCHLSGQPLPTIDLDLDGRSAKIEFSLGASQALIQHLLSSRNLADGNIALMDVDRTGRSGQVL
ncbi:hypothetical protein VTN96DRAFT_6845 [Rasamsonia emersonii]